MKSTSILSFLLLAYLLTGCLFPDESPEVLLARKGTKGLRVPDGFNYETKHQETFNLSFSENDKLYIELLNGNDSNSHALYSSYMKTSAKFTLDLPLHVDTVILKARYKNRLALFEISGKSGYQLQLTPQDFESPGDTTASDEGARVAKKGKNEKCLPDYVGAYYQQDIWWSNVYVIAYSSKEIGQVTLDYENGQQEKTETPALNYGTYWYLKADKDVQLKGMWIKAGCNGNDGEKKGWYVPNPYYVGNPDTDGDGVENELDVAPEDATIASVQYLPAESEYTTLAFEDLWPFTGDYDFNDFVVAHNTAIYVDASNYVSSIIYSFQIKAIGASLDNDFCLNFSDPNDAAVVSVMSDRDIAFEIIDLGEETEVRFPHVKKIFGQTGLINTYEDAPRTEVAKLTVTVTADQRVKLDKLETDLYLRINGEEGREIHLPGKKFTSLADHSLFKTGGDDTDTDTKLFLSKTNLPWAIEVPIDWKYPVERVDILEAYPNFKKFAQEDSDLVWYTDDPENMQDDKVFHP